MWTMPLEVRGSFLVYFLSWLSVRIAKPRVMFCVYALLMALLLSPQEVFGAVFSCPTVKGAGGHCALAAPLPGKTFRFYAAFISGLVLAEFRSLGMFDGVSAADHEGKQGAADRGFCIHGRWLLLLFAFLVSGSYRLYDTDGDDAISTTVGQDAETLLVMAATALVAFCSLDATAQRLLMHPICQWLGKVSFGLYLLHTTIFFSVGATVLTAVGSADNYFGAAMLALFVSLLVVLPLSHVFWMYVDDGLAGK
jgi:peptidoglycan/LPS O-acetylase OafA/YrhL